LWQQFFYKWQYEEPPASLKIKKKKSIEKFKIAEKQNEHMEDKPL